jgi:hypothetical protein
MKLVKIKPDYRPIGVIIALIGLFLINTIGPWSIFLIGGGLALLLVPKMPAFRFPGHKASPHLHTSQPTKPCYFITPEETWFAEIENDHTLVLWKVGESIATTSATLNEIVEAIGTLKHSTRPDAVARLAMMESCFKLLQDYNAGTL